MADRILTTLAVMILVVIGALLCSSGLNLVMDLNAHMLNKVQVYAGGTAISLSLVLACSNVKLTQHPLYEYWLLVAIGGMIGACYIN